MLEYFIKDKNEELQTQIELYNYLMNPRRFLVKKDPILIFTVDNYIGGWFSGKVKDAIYNIDKVTFKMFEEIKEDIVKLENQLKSFGPEDFINNRSVLDKRFKSDFHAINTIYLYFLLKRDVINPLKTDEIMKAFEKSVYDELRINKKVDFHLTKKINWTPTEKKYIKACEEAYNSLWVYVYED